MAYTSIEQETRDLDIFFEDNSKLVHIASAGGQIPIQLADNDKQNEEFASDILSFEQVFEIEVNPNLIALEIVSQNGLESYLIDFVLMARRGFYSYDKTKLGNFEDQFFHLVARPKGNETIEQDYKKENLLKINIELPSEFNSFNLFNLFDNN
jgi:hypothetical protein